MARYDTNFRLQKRVSLRIAVIYLPSYFLANDKNTLRTASDLLDEHNIGWTMWPYGGKKSSKNTLIDMRYRDPIPHERKAYQQLRKDVNELIRNRVHGFPYVVPVIFCQFNHPGHGITPPWSKLGAEPTACLISPNPQNDRMTVLHELGHAAGLHHENGSRHLKNVMHKRDGRENLYEHQVQTFGKASFTKQG